MNVPPFFLGLESTTLDKVLRSLVGLIIELEMSDRLPSAFNILKVWGWLGRILICWGLLAILTPEPPVTGRLVRDPSLVTRLMVLLPRLGLSLGTIVLRFPVTPAP